MSWIEILGTLTGVLCVWLTAIQNIWCWPVGLANNAFFLALFLRDRLYADSLLQVIYLVLGVYGWHFWLHGGRNSAALPVSRTPRAAWPALVALFAGGTAALALLLARGAGWLGVPPPDLLWWDAPTTVLCLLAQYMLTRKWLANWVLWIATNLSYLALYSVKGRPLIAALQLIFIAISLQGYRRWRTEVSRNEERESDVLRAPGLAFEPAPIEADPEE
jgi:nicotinamide mononucleotide transporter